MNYRKQIFTIIPLLFAGLFIWYFSSIFFYILIALILSLLGSPIVALLDKIKIGKIRLPHTLNAGIILFLMMTVVVMFFVIMIPVLSKQVNTLSKLDTTAIDSAFSAPISNLETTLKDNGLLEKSKNLSEVVKDGSAKILEKFKISDLFSDVMNFLTNIFAALFIISFVTFFVLRDNRIFYRVLIALVHESYHNEVEHIIQSTKRLLTRYFLGLILDISLVSGLYAIILSILGVQNALLIGFLGGIVNVIPYIGPFIGAAIGLFVGVVSGLPMDFNTELIPLVIKILSTFFFVNLLDATVMQPNIYAKSVNAHPLEIFFVIIVAGTIAGIAGMILAIPTYSFLRILAREFFYKYPIVQKLTNSMGKD
ncbi:MAG: AI-2E family transporter [Bacteroidota bacterium]